MFTAEDAQEIPTPDTFFVASRSEELHQFEINREKVLGHISKLYGNKSPGLAGMLETSEGIPMRN